MKALNTYIREKLDVNEDYSRQYNYQPKNTRELESLLKRLIAERGNEGDFNDIDTSLITNMAWLFEEKYIFNGDISRWDTSNVTTMHAMFSKATKFNQDISKWNTSNVTDMTSMFKHAKSFNQDISGWNVNKVLHYESMFTDCPIKDSYKPEFK